MPLAVGTLLGGAALARGQERSFADLTIEELLNEPVTSVSRKETSLRDSPAAVSVLTSEDIRRLGVTTVAEALRFMPGMQVGRMDAHSWAISSRGFQGEFADKLLVMIDGRSVYESFFPGVNWDAHEVPLADLDHIEVIRGPGATLWGANAVNGVVSILTKSARDTQGAHVSVDAGSEERPTVNVRYGGALSPALHYRVSLSYFKRGGLVDARGNDTPHAWEGLRAGLRVDWTPSERDRVMLTADTFKTETGDRISVPLLTPPYARTYDEMQNNYGSHVLARWIRTISPGSELTVQGFFAHSDHPLLNYEAQDDLADLEVQHRFTAFSRHELIWGLGYRQREEHYYNDADLEFRQIRQLPTGFVQDEITVVPERLRFIAGSKFEDNDYTGFEVQPGARLLFTPSRQQSLWAAVSRAVRIPDLVEHENAKGIDFRAVPGPGGLPVVVRIVGNREVRAEELVAYEIGYRVEPTPRLSLDFATFYNVYDHLIERPPGTPYLELTPGPPHLVQPRVARNVRSAEGYGFEAVVQWQITDAWRLAADYSRLDFVQQPYVEEFDHPREQARLRSTVHLPRGWELHSALLYTAPLSVQSIPGYLRFDVGLLWQVSSAWEIGVWGHNLLDRQHPEFTSFVSGERSEVPRSFTARVTWKF